MTSLSISLSTAPAPEQFGADAILSFENSSAIIHIGEQPEVNRTIIQKAARTLDNLCEQVSLTGDWRLEQQWAFATSFTTPKKQNAINWSPNQDLEALQHLYEAHLFCRNLINGSPQDVYPESLCSSVSEWLTKLAPEHTSVKSWVGEELAEAGWVGTYEVGRGSDRPPVLLEVDFNPTGDTNAPVSAALVGKGITFDSGGYSIKPSESMLFMKCDMGGAATVASAMGLAIMQGLNTRVKLYLCCAENLISGHAYKLGDILTYKNGTTVEIVNTDAEGRLVLADGLIAASETGAPLIIDAATLTGAAMVAVGSDYNAIFSMDEELSQKTQQAAKKVKEPVWPLPLEPWHQHKCPSNYADTANSRPQKGGGSGGASNAAGFLARFVENNESGWIHFDLAAAFNNNGTATQSAGATATGIRTIAALLTDQ